MSDDFNALLDSINEEYEEKDSSDSEVLSQDEVSDLLSAVSNEGEQESSSEEEWPSVTIYDFIRPDFMLQSDLQRVHTKCEELLNRTVPILNGFIASEIAWKISDISALTNEEFFRCLPNPAAIIPIHFASGYKGMICTSSRTMQLFMNLFWGLPGEPSSIDPASLTQPFLKKTAAFLMKRSFGPCLDSLMIPGFLGDFTTDPVPPILGDPLEMQIVTAVDLSMLDGGYSDLFNIVLPRYWVEETRATFKGEIENGGDVDSPNPNDSGQDFLVKKLLCYKTLQSAGEITSILAEGSSFQVDPRTLGRMDYERREDS